VPLSGRALAILARLGETKTGDFVFPGQKPGKPLSAMAMEMVLRRMKSEVTVHGFRSSFRDWCGEETHFPREIAEAALAHAIGNEVEAAYRRGDSLEKRRAIMQAWADFIEGKVVGNVVPIRKAALPKAPADLSHDEHVAWYKGLSPEQRDLLWLDKMNSGGPGTELTAAQREQLERALAAKRGK